MGPQRHARGWLHAHDPVPGRTTVACQRSRTPAAPQSRWAPALAECPITEASRNWRPSSSPCQVSQSRITAAFRPPDPPRRLILHTPEPFWFAAAGWPRRSDNDPRSQPARRSTQPRADRVSSGVQPLDRDGQTGRHIDASTDASADRVCRNAPVHGAFLRADGGTRTPDPIITSDVLYQLSYVGAGEDGSDRSGA